MEILPDGQNCDSVRLGPLVVRRARHSKAASALYREAEVLPLLRHILPLPIPVPRIMELNSQVIAVHAAVPGDPLRSVQMLSDTVANKLADQMGAFLYRLHTAPICDQTFTRFGIPQANSEWWQSFARNIQTRVLPELPVQHREVIQSTLATHLDRLPALPTTLIHGDFGIGNILWDGNQITGIIDFGSMCWADPGWDVASVVAGFGMDFARRMSSSYAQLEERFQLAEFYRLMFALMEADFGAEHGNPEILHDGIEGVLRVLSGDYQS